MITAIIVDDEKAAREGLHTLLQPVPDIEVLAICPDGLSAIQAIQERQPDLVFLDIQMPEINGFEVLNSLGTDARPAVVFVTAYDQFALDAFGQHALDYLLKPITPARLMQSLGHVRKLLGNRLAEHRSQLNQLLESVPAEQSGQLLHTQNYLTQHRLLIKEGGKIHFVAFEDILMLQAEDVYVQVHTLQQKYLVRDSLSSLLEKLPTSQFSRVHRSYGVNLAMIETIEPYFNGEFILHLKLGNTVKVSRKYSGQFKGI